jgi:hypothetical protein
MSVPPDWTGSLNSWIRDRGPRRGSESCGLPSTRAVSCVRANGIDGWAERMCTEKRAGAAQCQDGRQPGSYPENGVLGSVSLILMK